MEKTYTIGQLNAIIDHHIKVFKDTEATYLGMDNGEEANTFHIAAKTLEAFKKNLNDRIKD